MPVSGKVIETNKLLLKEPTLVNSEPFENGWMIKIEIENSQEIEKLLAAEQYTKITNT